MKAAMRTSGMVWAVVACLVGSGAAHAGDETALASKSGCLACHAVDHKVIGPAYKEVAAKYRGDGTAAARLYTKVKAGGAGVWGPIPMPPNQQVSDKDIHTLVDWVLSQK